MYKYNFFRAYGEMVQRGYSTVLLRREIAKGCGVGESAIRTWEKLLRTSDFSISPADLAHICKVLETTEAEFVNTSKNPVVEQEALVFPNQDTVLV